LNIEVRDGVLTVEGKRDQDNKTTYLHQGIAGRGFQRQFQLAEHMEVRGARLENGLLSVDLERVIPDEKKPRRISINAPELKTIGSSKAA
jgi:molecular chaperone IbpA